MDRVARPCHGVSSTFRAAASCSVLLALVFQPGYLPQADPGGLHALQPYLDIIEQYRRGNTDAAGVTLRSWPETQTVKAARALMDRRSPAGQIADVPAMFAAAMAHSDVAVIALETEHPSEAAFHLEIAADLLAWTELAVKDSRQWLFARRDWRLAIVRVLNFYFASDVEQSLRHPQAWVPIEVKKLRARDLTEDGADMELAVGSLAEGFSYMTARDPSRRGNAEAVQREYRQRAGEHFRRALVLNPNLVEARLHLGRVLLDEKQIADGEIELRAVVARTSSPRVVYLALLFLGGSAEQRQNIEEAAGLYRKAMDVQPDSQAAALAFAYASERAGRLDVARSVLASMLRRNQGQEPLVDYWVSYRRGQFQDGFDALDKFRAAVTRR
jgi:tetratricopeptide (TPR) repeat protein